MTNSTSSTSMALLTQLQMVGTLVFLARAAVLVCTASDGGDSWKLNMLTVTAEKIEGTFLTPNRGIHFLSEAYGDSQRFSVVTIDGNQIIFAERKDKSATLVSLTGKDFLLVNKFFAGSTVMDYVVPPALSRQIKDSLRGRRITQKLLRHLDRSGVNATRDDAFKELIMRPEVELIVAAAKALGNTGLRGRRSPAAMTFYVFAKQLAMVKMHELGSLVGEGGESGFDERLLQHYQRREKRSREYCDNIPSGIFFSNDRYCPRGECPVGDKCLGMCGPQCSVCWDYWFICDDCCFHRGCYDHDLCCGRDGYLSWSCLTVVFDFDCDRYDCSQRCDPNPCLNGGTCIEEAGSFRCNCTNQFAGSICRRRRWCVPDPCQNGGRCIEDTDGFRCMCTPQYNGNTCGLRRWCVPDPCQNGGTCIEEAHNFTCTCPPQFTGDTCEQAVGCIPNPCQNGGICTEGLSKFNCTEWSNCTTGHAEFNCTEGSNCTKESEFNCTEASNCTELHSTFTCTCPSKYTGIQCEQFDYCYSNPCQNGGHCLLLSNGYWCNCEGSTGVGSNCEHRVGCFRVYARGGTGLPDEDGWFNDSDPYLEVIAYDYLGNSLRKRTNEDSGDESPEWNESLIFGCRAWKKFTVKVWDEDIFSDDALSSSETFYLNSFPIQRTFVRHNAYSGYVRFDYYFE